MMPRHFQIALALLFVGIFGAAAYIIRLRQIEEDRITRRYDTRPVSAPGAGPQQNAVLYIAFDEDSKLRREERRLSLPADPAERAREVLRVLLAEYNKKPSPHPIGEGADVRAVFLVNDKLAVVDLNAAFADGHRSGVLVESLTVESLTRTLAANVPGLEQVQILVEGKPRETLAGHADLTGALLVER